MAEPLNRRAALGAIAAAGALLAVPAASAALEAPDAEIIALGAEIVRRAAEAEHCQETHIDPLEEPWRAIFLNPSKRESVRREEARRYGEESGRDLAITALEKFDAATDRLFTRLMSIPATTQPGRAAKVRALLVHVVRSEWRGPESELDWNIAWARTLLGEFAGMSADELAEA